MNNRTTTFLAACLCATLWSCAPLHARSISDATSSWQAASVLGHCYVLRRDVALNRYSANHTLDDSRGTAFAYDGFLYAWPANSSAPAGVPLLRTGAHFTVERVLANHEPMVGVVMKPYVRVDDRAGGGLFDASSLFEFTDDSKALKPVKPFLDVCT